MPCYFFADQQYVRVVRGETGPGGVDLGYPAPIGNWGWGKFGSGKKGIDAALSSGPVDYFFSGKEYIRVSRGTTGAGTVDAGYPQPIANWGWGKFGENGIDAALSSGGKCYFFCGKEYIRVTRGDRGPGTVDPGYPMSITEWGWGEFGKNGIDAALNSGPVDYFFSGRKYIRVTRGETGAGQVDPGYPAPLSNWGWGTFALKGIQAALFSGIDAVVGDMVPPPARLGNNSNYFLLSNCDELTNVTVTVNVTQDMVCQSVTRGTQLGFGFQLNSYSPKSHSNSFQQYVVAVLGEDVYAWIDDLPPTGTGLDLLNFRVKFAELKGGKLPAGFQVKISLQNDSANNVSGATYSLVSNEGKLLGEKTLLLASIPGGQVALAPIVAFVMNIVGPENGEDSFLSSGRGSILYQAFNPLAAVNNFPSCVEEAQFTTELSNIVYGQLPAGPNRIVAQSFDIGPAA